MNSNLDGVKIWVIFFIFLIIAMTASTQNPNVAIGVGIAGVVTMWMIHIVKSGGWG